MIISMNDRQVKRFWSKVDKTPGYGPWGDCWLWTKAIVSGYGYHGINRKLTYTHRISWVLFNKKQIPDGLLVLHICDVKRCVNPIHLFTGDHKKNTEDMINKGRMITTCKIPTEELLNIINLKASGISARELANRYQVSWSLIYKICRREFSTQILERRVI